MVYGETGRTPLDVLIKTRMVCFWHKIITGVNTKLSYRLLYLLNKLNEQNQYEPKQYSSHWPKKVKEILESCNMMSIWLNPKSIKPNQLRKALTKQLTNKYKLKWLSDIEKKSSCIIYKTFKTEFKLERYLMLPDSVDRINISKFRCRNSKIPAAILGHRDRHTPYKERICSACNIGAIGDEFHYIMQCPVFQLQRQRSIETKYLINPNKEKFLALLQNNNFSILRKLAKLITEINVFFK